MKTLRLLSLMGTLFISCMIKAQEADTLKPTVNHKDIAKDKLILQPNPFVRANSKNISTAQTRMIMKNKIKDEEERRNTKRLITTAYLVFFIICFSL